jgi:phenylpropionate dioxygenase-like ring-hydroxylating dioxygenase large terminal subunit
VGVPQGASGGGGNAVVARSARACAHAFPTREAQGLLWLFPSAAPGAATTAAATPMPLIPGLDGEAGPPAMERSTPYVRDFPYGLDTLLENLCDPAHVAWSHHGVGVRELLQCVMHLYTRADTSTRLQGDRARAPATPMRVTAPLSPAGFAVYTPGDPGKHPPQTVRTCSVDAKRSIGASAH